MNDMGKVLWHTMMSLDGFIAGPNDEMEWMSGIDGGEGRKIDEVLGSTGALLVGRRTQDVEDRDQPGFYGGAYTGPFFVLRHDPPADPPVVKGVEGEFLNVDITRQFAWPTQLRAPMWSCSAPTSLGSVWRRDCWTRSSSTLPQFCLAVAFACLNGMGTAVPLRFVSSTQEGETTVLHYATT